MEIYRRLTLLMMFLTCMGFGGAWFYYDRQLRLVDEVLPFYQRTLNEYKVECSNFSESKRCLDKAAFINNSRMYDILDEYKANKKTYVKAMFLIPLCILFVYLGLGWVLTGKIPKIKN